MLGQTPERLYEVNGATMPDVSQDIQESEVEATSAFDSVESSSAFDPANFTQVTTIMLMRLYDLQLALLSSVNPEQAKYIVDLHERGQSFAPAPAFAEYVDES